MNWQDMQYLEKQFAVLLAAIKKQGETQMSELDDKTNAINTALASLKTDLTAAIADLKNQIANAGPTATQLQALDNIVANIGTLDTQAKAE